MVVTSTSGSDLFPITKLDSGAVQPAIRDVAVMEMLEPLAEQFAPLAADRGLELHVVPTRLTVRTDPRMMKRVLQKEVINELSKLVLSNTFTAGDTDINDIMNAEHTYLAQVCPTVLRSPGTYAPVLVSFCQQSHG